MRMYATSQLARTLSTLLAGGLPLVNALEGVGSLGRQPSHGAGGGRRHAQIREGRSLTVALESNGLLEDVALEMIKVGEADGERSATCSAPAAH